MADSPPLSDVLINKAAIIERCVARVREVYAGDPCNLLQDITRQDSILLNLQRACEAAIDLAMHLVHKHRLGPPQESRDAFVFLAKADILDRPLAERMMRMVGFRNIAIHNYRHLDLQIVQSIITDHLEFFLTFSSWALTHGQSAED